MWGPGKTRPTDPPPQPPHPHPLTSENFPRAKYDVKRGPKWEADCRYTNLLSSSEPPGRWVSFCQRALARHCTEHAFAAGVPVGVMSRRRGKMIEG